MDSTSDVLSRKQLLIANLKMSISQFGTIYGFNSFTAIGNYICQRCMLTGSLIFMWDTADNKRSGA